MQLSAATRWLLALWIASLLLTRFRVPGVPVALLVPVVLAWTGWVLLRGHLVFDRTRLGLFSLAIGLGAVLMPLQLLFVQDVSVSITSWLLVAAVWVPFTLRLKVAEDFRPFLRVVAWTGVALSVLAIVMLATQLLGLKYHDWFADLFPANLLFQTDWYVITYPIEYGSEIYRSNAWIGVEPSFVSAQLGITMLAAMMSRMRWWVVALHIIALGATFSGSGVFIVIVGVVVALLHRYPLPWRSYLATGLVALPVLLATGALGNMLSRATEAGAARSSTSLRTVLPYQALWSILERDIPGLILGRGPGSAQDAVDKVGIAGLLVPTPLKLVFEYGLIGGLALGLFMLACIVAVPSRTMAISQFVSLWTIQAGSTSVFLLIPLVVLATAWSPYAGTYLEAARKRVNRDTEDVEEPAEVEPLAPLPPLPMMRQATR